jgi:hypothetical protein
VARDVTAEKEAEEERERLVAQLQSALAEITVLQESEGMRLEGSG